MWNRTASKCAPVVAQGATREAARDAAYAATTPVTFAGLHRRNDIGTMHFEA